jgi:translation initiation factor 1
MPFTIGGDYVPPEKISSKQEKKPNKPVKIRVEKKKNSLVTVVENLDMSEEELKSLLSQLKRSYGCGGTIKDGKIFLQGNLENQMITFFKK